MACAKLGQEWRGKGSYCGRDLECTWWLAYWACGTVGMNQSQMKDQPRLWQLSKLRDPNRCPPLRLRDPQGKRDKTLRIWWVQQWKFHYPSSNKFPSISTTMSSFDNFDLDFSLESTQSSFEKEFLVAEEHCKTIEQKCEASKAKVTKVKTWFDKLLGDEKRVFFAEVLTPVMNSHMVNVEELKGVRKARDSAKTAMVGVLRFSMSKSLMVELQGSMSRAMVKLTLVKTTGDLKSMGLLKGKVSIISYVILSH
jgi:hypothetical protein